MSDRSAKSELIKQQYCFDYASPFYDLRGSFTSMCRWLNLKSASIYLNSEKRRLDLLPFRPLSSMTFYFGRLKSSVSGQLNIQSVNHSDNGCAKN